MHVLCSRVPEGSMRNYTWYVVLHIDPHFLGDELKRSIGHVFLQIAPNDKNDEFKRIPWVKFGASNLLLLGCPPAQYNSHHQDDYIFSRGPLWTFISHFYWGTTQYMRYKSHCHEQNHVIPCFLSSHLVTDQPRFKIWTRKPNQWKVSKIGDPEKLPSRAHRRDPFRRWLRTLTHAMPHKWQETWHSEEMHTLKFEPSKKQYNNPANQLRVVVYATIYDGF